MGTPGGHWSGKLKTKKEINKQKKKQKRNGMNEPNYNRYTA